MPVELAPFYVSLLDRDKVLKDRTHALQEATVAALSSCRETRQHLFEVGVLRSAASSEVEAQVREIFARFRTCPDPGQMAYEENGRLVRPEEVVGVIRLLVQLETENPTPEGPTLHPRVDFSIYDDWKVDRSMLHFEPLQGVLQRKYRYGGQMMNHLVIGPGDCSAARELSAHPSSGLWNYPAVGDILFYLIEKVMAQFIRADKRDDEAVRQCVDIISRRLRSHLRREWYQGAGNARRQLRKVKRTDLNEIFPFLADPTWLEQDVKDQKVKASQEFDEDSWELLPDRVYELILGYLGWPEEKVREHMLQVQLAGLKERSWEVRHSFHSITYVKNRVAEYTTPALQDQWLLELCEIMDDYSLLEEPRDLLTRVKECMVRIRARRREIGGSYEAERHGLSQGAERERRRGLEALQAEEGILRERFQRVKLHFDGIPPEARRQYHVAFREESSGLRGRAAAEELRAADRLQAADDVLKSVHLVGQEKERDRLTEKLRRLKDFENKVSTARNEVGDSDKVWSDAAGELAQLVGAKKLNTPHRSTVVMQHIDGMLEQRKAAQLAIERKIASVQQALQDLQKTKTQPDGVAVDGGERSPGDAPGDSDSHPHLKGLGELFSPYFLKGVKWASHYAGGKYDRMGNYPNTDTPVIDLHALVPLEVGAHFIPGDFLMIPGLIPDDSVHLATADKSDTHLRAWPFEQHIRNLLSKLAPGGYICTMGLVGSYDRLPRVFEMRRLEEVFSPEYLFEVELNPESREITRIHIQRSHHKGFLNDAEKSEAFGDTAKFDTLGRITARPDVFVLNHVIRRIDRLAEEDQDVFNQLNDHLRDMLRRLALDLGMQKVRSWYPGIADGDIAETMAAGDVHFDLETWIVRQIQTPVTEEGTLFERMDFDELIRLLEETLYEQAERLGLDVAEDRRFGGRRVRGSSGRIVVPGRLETFQSEQLNTVPRIDLPVSRWNRFCHLDPRNKLPGNEELLTGEARERLQEKIQELRIKLVKLRRQLGGKEPLTLVD
ncbi:MAG: hypothetical protein Q8P95_04155, partial [bacterium]|nr:hypothetical protein [bacterium]